jgi:hypothetical protein
MQESLLSTPQEHKPAQHLGRLILPTKLKNKQQTVIKHKQQRRQVEQ